MTSRPSPSEAEIERAAIVDWIADKAAEHERMVKSVFDMLNPAERAKCVTTSCAYRFIQHAIERGAHQGEG